jgi:hypothetical protein
MINSSEFTSERKVIKVMQMGCGVTTYGVVVKCLRFMHLKVISGDLVEMKCKKR